MSGSVLSDTPTLARRRAAGDSLFANAEAVVEFGAASFDHLVRQSKRAWLVMYYATWCPHCQRCAPSFDQVAVAFRSDNRVSIGALDCSKASNSNLCVSTGISGLPTLRAYNFEVSAGLDDYGSIVGASCHYPSDLVSWLGKKLNSIKDWDLRLEEAEKKAYPTSTTTTTSSTEPPPEPAPLGIGFFKPLQTRKKNQAKCLGVAKPGFRPIAVVKDCDETSTDADDLKWRFDGMQLRSMYAKEACLLASVEANVYVTKACMPVHNQQWFMKGKQLRIHKDIRCLTWDNQTGSVNTESCNGAEYQEWTFEPVNPSFAHLVDAEVGLVSSLRQGVVLAAGQSVDVTKPHGRPVLAGDALADLKAWLRLLVALLPSTKAVGHVSDLLFRIGERESDGSVDAQWLISSIDKQQVGRAPFDAAKDAGNCLLSCETFTCSLWTLFHLLVIGSAENVDSANATDSSNYLLDSIAKPAPGDVLLRIRNFVARFFGCADCVSHFVGDFDACKFDRCGLAASDGQGAALWLWRTHNEVTARVMLEKGFGHADAWPPKSLCSECWKTRADSENILWDKLAVYKYLKQTYWHTDWRAGGMAASDSQGVSSRREL